MGAVAGLTFGCIIGCIFLAAGPDRLFSWPILPCFMLFAFLYSYILAFFLGKLEVGKIAPPWDPFPNQTGLFRLFSIGGLCGVIVFSIGGLFWRHLPLWGILTLGVLMLASLGCLVVGMADNLFGRKGIFRSEKKSEDDPNKRVDRPA